MEIFVFLIKFFTTLLVFDGVLGCGPQSSFSNDCCTSTCSQSSGCSAPAASPYGSSSSYGSSGGSYISPSSGFGAHGGSSQGGSSSYISSSGGSFAPSGSSSNLNTGSGSSSSYRLAKLRDYARSQGIRIRRRRLSSLEGRILNKLRGPPMI